MSYQVGYAIAIVLACAVALGLGLFSFALVTALGRAPDLIVPATEQSEQLKAHPVGPGEFPPDLAWPFYPYRQKRADQRRTAALLTRANNAAWRVIEALFKKTGWALFPLGIAGSCFLVVASATSWACYLVYALVNSAGQLASLSYLGLATTALRLAERVRRGRLQTQAACMNCFHVTPWPAYQCPRCRRAHHDLHPGRLGLLFRRCSCGLHLPTLPSRAAWRLIPLCKRCDSPLPAGTGALRDIRLPVFGDVSAGKTRFVFAALNRLIAATSQDVSFMDENSGRLADFGLGVIRSGRETAKTSTNTQVTLNFRLGTGHRGQFVHLFDAAGEHFRSARRPEALRFLDDGQGLVYVIDPFSIPSVRQQTGWERTPALFQAHAAEGDPELTYEEVASRLSDSGVAVGGQRLAVVVSKADLLRSAGLTLPSGSAEVAQWLRDHGVHNLVMSAPHEFAEVRYFMVASQNVRPGSPHDPGAPLHWLLSSQGVPLPADVPGGQPDARPSRGEHAEARS
jgi:hypothetical protein